ncbi:class B sortase [Paenibacillus chondroitinus]|uniref:Class B sortase n=1 Tax=Paenibacillus chondroitinus TaxID=59842 RepID=A0ABU6D9H4_9BACL|nr:MULTISPECIES: class B sortase [Paenibacillus]MCY9661907.1 class B sortase [Paenibacillus anseongense]MEB4793593.1 class B sortase [Paenibacillus chondroitinus]
MLLNLFLQFTNRHNVDVVIFESYLGFDLVNIFKKFGRYDFLGIACLRLSLNHSYRVDIFAVYYTTTEFNYIQTDFGDTDEYASFLHTIQNRSIYETNEALTASDSILTLSTCDYTLDAKEGRLVIHGKLTPLTE